MKKVALILFSGFMLLLNGCGADSENRPSVEEVEEFADQLAECQAQLQAMPENEWNRWVDTQYDDIVLWHGLTVGEVKEDLLLHEALIPIEGVRDGVDPRFSETDMYVGDYSVLAYASDGHWEEQIFLSYQVEDGVISWAVIAYTNEGQLHLMNE